MKVNIEILNSCTIKRKKPCPKIKWIGKEKEKLCLIENQKINLLDPNNGNVKRFSSQIKSFQKSIVAYNITDNGIYFVAILTNGDILIWNKDTDSAKVVEGLSEFALKLNNHAPSIFLSNDSKKIILIRNSSKIYVWESEDVSSANGNWSNIVTPKEIKTVEDNKELVIDARFIQNSINGHFATCLFVFNYENKTRINILQIKWNNNKNKKFSDCHFNTMWISYEPKFYLNNYFGKCNENSSSDIFSKFEPLSTRGAYVVKISHHSDLAVIALNQKKTENCLLSFVSIANGKIKMVSLNNFGLNQSAQGRKYWIQELCWTYNDLFVAGISKHGAFFLITRLGQPLFIHAIGKEINIGPALFLTFHPLILIRGKNESSIKSDDCSINSTLNNGKNQKQVFSLSQHPSLPILVCSDGFLMCILKIPTAFSEPIRIIKELVNEVVEQMNSISKSIERHQSFDFLKNKLDNGQCDNDFFTKKTPLTSLKNLPDWGLETKYQNDVLDKSCDSGVDSVNEHYKNKPEKYLSDPKIADGKIIFSFLPQVLPISNETINIDSLPNRLELCVNYLISSWSLVITQSNYDPINLNENENICKVIQQAFINLTCLLFNIENNAIKDFFRSTDCKQNQTEDESFEKIKISIRIFFIFIKTLHFSSIDSINFMNISGFIEKFTQSILKCDSLIKIDFNYSFSRIQILSLTYSVLKCSENVLKTVFSQQKNCSFSIKFDNSDVKKSLRFSIESLNIKGKNTLDIHSDKSNGSSSDKFETDSLEKLNSRKNSLILKKINFKQILTQIDFIMEKSWKNLFHYCYKYRKILQKLGKIREDSLNELNFLIIVLEREIQKLTIFKDLSEIGRGLNARSVNNHESELNYDLGKADLIYLNLGDLDKAVDFWIIQLNSIFDNQINNFLENKSDIIIHKVFYSCLTNYDMFKFLNILESLIENEHSRYNKNGENLYSRYSLFENSFDCLNVPKPLQKLPIAIVSVIKSLARFISLYLINSKELFHLSIINPKPMPSLIECLNKTPSNLIKNILSKEKFNLSLVCNKTAISNILKADKVFEMFIVTELYDEAIFFLNSINDWKSSFLTNSILKESLNYEKIEKHSALFCKTYSEKQLALKVCSIFGLDNQLSNDFESNLMEKSYEKSACLVLKELLLCSVMTKSTVLEPILFNLMRNFVLCTKHICSENIIVPDNFYLPAPPIFCTQLNLEEYLDILCLEESKYRHKLCILSKCIIVLFKESNLFVPMIKWYLESLSSAKNDMKNVYGIKNKFSLDISLKNLLSTIRYQKIGYIPQAFFNLFREFIALVFLIDVRDKFSSALRQFFKIMLKNVIDSKIYIDLCKNIINYGILLLNFRSLIGQEYSRVQDIVLSTIAKLEAIISDEPGELDLEYQLVKCIEKLSWDNMDKKNKNLENINIRNKFQSIKDNWKKISNSNIGELFEHKIKILNNENILIQKYYGINEDILHMKYIQNISDPGISLSGSFSIERSELLFNFLDFFFKFAFDHSDNWEIIANHVNNIPLIPEFYEVIREQELNQNDYRKYVSKKKSEDSSNQTGNLRLNIKKRKSKFSLNKISDLRSTISFIEEETLTKKGLFRTYSLKNISERKSILNKKSSSFGDFKKLTSEKITHKKKAETNSDQPFNILNYGSAYENVSTLAIWLIKWSRKFQKILLDNNKILNQIDSKKYLESKTTIKLNLNANMLVASVYIANNNSLIWSSRNKLIKSRSVRRKKKEDFNEIDDEFTQVTNSNLLTSRKINEKSLMNKKFNNDLSNDSTTIDLSSYSDNEIKLETKTKQKKIHNQPILNDQNNNINKIENSFSNKHESEVFSSILDLTEYYDFENLKQSENILKSIENLDSNEPKNTSTSTLTVINEQTIKHEDKNEIKKKRNSFESITNIFKNLKSPSRSPSKLKKHDNKPSLVDAENKPTQIFQKTDRTIQSYGHKQNESNLDTLNFNNSSQVHQIIRDEFIKIVQLQHSTVMNFLNNQSSESCEIDQIKKISSNQSSLGLTNFQNQLISKIKNSILSNDMSEFVIETSIKKVENKSQRYSKDNIEKYIQQKKNSHLEEVQPNYFLKSFDSNKKKTKIESEKKMSKLVNIPLLGITDTKIDQQSDIQLPYIFNSVDQNVSCVNQCKQNYKKIGFSSALLETKKVNKNTVAKNPSFKLDKLDSLRKNDEIFQKSFTIMSQESKKGTLSSIQNYPLLKLNATNEIFKPNIQKQQIENQTNKEASFSQLPNEIPEKLPKKETTTITSDAHVQVQKPMYDGYILSPDCFQNMIESSPIENFSSAKAHYEATSYFRNKNDNKQKDSCTMTDFYNQVTYQLPPDILLNLKFDTNQNNRQKESLLCNDFINIADLDNKSVEEILELIKLDQNKPKKKDETEKIKDINAELDSNKNIQNIEENSIIKDSFSKELIEEIPSIMETQNFELSINDKKMEILKELENENLTDEANFSSTSNKLQLLDEKIQSMTKMANEMNEENRKKYENIQTIEADLQNNKDKVKRIKSSICTDSKVNEEILSKKDKKEFTHMKNKMTNDECDTKTNLSDDLSDLNDFEQKRLSVILEDSNRLNDSLKNKPTKNKDISVSEFKDREPRKTIKEQQKLNFDQISSVKKNEKKLIEKRESMIEKFAQKREQDARSLLKDLIEDNTLVVKNFTQKITSARSVQNKKLKYMADENKDRKFEMNIPPLLLDVGNEIDSILTETKISNPKTKPSLMLTTINNLGLKEEIENKRTQLLLHELEKRATNVTDKIITEVQIKNTKSLSDYVRLQNPKKLRTQPNHKALTYSQRLMMHQKSEIKSINSKESLNELYKVYGSKRIKGIQRQEIKEIFTSNGLQKGLKNPLQKRISKPKKDKIDNFKQNSKNRYSPYNQSIPSNEIEELVRWSIDDNLKKILYGNQENVFKNNKANFKNRKLVKKTRDIDQDTLADLDIDYLEDEFLDENETYVNQVTIDELMNISLSTDSSISCIDWDQINQICELYQK